MFKQFDPNGNGYLSLAEVEKGFYIEILFILGHLIRFEFSFFYF
jgi:hypothetical protein